MSIVNRIVSHIKCSFNSQPPGGGWIIKHQIYIGLSLFQLTAARRRLASEPK